MKRHLFLAACYALAFSVTALAQGESGRIYRYYGAGPYVGPPYWQVPDLTKLADADARASSLDLTLKEATTPTYPPTWLRGKVVGDRPYPFVHPRTYVDHVTTGSSLMTTRPATSVLALQSAPTISSLAPRYNASLNYWQTIGARPSVGRAPISRQSAQRLLSNRFSMEQFTVRNRLYQPR